MKYLLLVLFISGCDPLTISSRDYQTLYDAHPPLAKCLELAEALPRYQRDGLQNDCIKAHWDDAVKADKKRRER